MPRTTDALDAERAARDLTLRPVAELRRLRWAVVPTVLGTIGVALACAVVPALVYPVHAVTALVGAALAVMAAVGAYALSEHPACAVVWGNHRFLNRAVHAWAPIGMLAWAGAMLAMLASRAQLTMNTTAPQWLQELGAYSWFVYLPCFVAGSLGTACVSELLATLARAAQDDGAADRLRFSVLAKWLMLVFCIPMWWSILTMWGGPGMIVAVGAGILVLACFARFVSGYVPLLSITKWLVLNAEDGAGHAARVQEIQANRVRVRSAEEEDAPKARGAREEARQTEPWAKPVFKNSNVVKKAGERGE